MIELKGKNVTVLDGELKRRERKNRTYLMKLTNENLLFNYNLEAGRFEGREVPKDAHTGWESPVCQLRGHFLGHWLCRVYASTRKEVLDIHQSACIPSDSVYGPEIWSPGPVLVLVDGDPMQIKGSCEILYRHFSGLAKLF